MNITMVTRMQLWDMTHEHNIESVQHGDLKGAINIKKISGLDCASAL